MFNLWKTKIWSVFWSKVFMYGLDLLLTSVATIVIGCILVRLYAWRMVPVWKFPGFLAEIPTKSRLFCAYFWAFYFRCVICMGEFIVGDSLRYLPCVHTYHKDCIDDWLMRSFTCPSCMEPVDSALLMSYETNWSISTSQFFFCLSLSQSRRWYSIYR